MNDLMSDHGFQLNPTYEAGSPPGTEFNSVPINPLHCAFYCFLCVLSVSAVVLYEFLLLRCGVGRHCMHPGRTLDDELRGYGEGEGRSLAGLAVDLEL